MSQVIIFSLFLILGWCLASFIEWFVHKELMHTKKYMKTPFIRHAAEHHGERKSPGRYYAKTDELKEYHLFETSFMPFLWILHFPIVWLVAQFTGLAGAAGCGMGTALYILGYEIIHWYVHIPEDFPFYRSKWFQFLLEHHRIHHHIPTKNYNVVFPLADWVLGSLTTEYPLKREPEDIVKGTPAPPQWTPPKPK